MDMEQQPERVLEATTTSFSGMCSSMDPEASWVARWVGVSGMAPGVYARPDTAISTHIECEALCGCQPLCTRAQCAATDEQKWACARRRPPPPSRRLARLLPSNDDCDACLRYAMSVATPAEMTEEFTELLEQNGVELRAG